MIHFNIKILIQYELETLTLCTEMKRKMLLNMQRILMLTLPLIQQRSRQVHLTLFLL